MSIRFASVLLLISVGAAAAETHAESLLTTGAEAMVSTSTADEVDVVSDHNGSRWLSAVRRLNVRAGPSVDSQVMITLRAGRELVEVARLNPWILVDVPIANLQGWVFAPLLWSAEAKDAPLKSSGNFGKRRWISAQGVRLRLRPGTQSGVVSMLDAETEVVVLGQRAGWIEVEVASTGSRGWVFDALTSASLTEVVSSKDVATSPLNVPRRWVVLHNRVEIKSAPETNSKALASLAQGTEVLATSRRNNWLRVRGPGGRTEGWLHVEGVERSEIVAAGAVAFIKHLSESAREVRGPPR